MQKQENNNEYMTNGGGSLDYLKKLITRKNDIPEVGITITTPKFQISAINSLTYSCQVIIPVYHPDGKLLQLLDSLKKQTVVPLPILILDSGSTGSYREKLNGLDVKVQYIDCREFNHGGTRQKAMDSCNADIYVYMTQDAILADEYAIENLLQAFCDQKIGCAYGRQLPHHGAGAFARFARSFNYGDKSYVRELHDKKKYGIKTAFISNSFAAYRREAMKEIGGFATDLILSEDMYAAAKMLLAGWKVAYRADACVHHSHDYTVWQECSRYFDIGVFQKNEKWIRQIFGKAEGEGIKFIKEEFKYIFKINPLLLFEMIIRDSMKYVGYKLGYLENNLPLAVKKKISMNKRYW